MAGNYNNIDLANKMESISTREYLLSASKMTVHHLLEETFIPLGQRTNACWIWHKVPLQLKKNPRNSHRQTLD